ncbi:MAG TPA: glycosyltransferase family 2 protein [Candidatus Chromulinivoraceae bacterium]|nr:glycosyltransferase family 2 protein [Candidatus Chromulinivoraceae bacterium]
MAIFLTLAGIIIMFATFFAVRLALSLGSMRPHLTKPLSSKDLPTVSVCIPARNEKHAMTQCLERVLASDYEKLEVVVFDDSSDDETSVLIRSFAHVGVRFVPGTELPGEWLGRNRALDILAHEASGDYIVFMDVDTYITVNSITRLMSYMKTSSKDMISVIPSRQDVWRMSVLFSPLRYFWQLILSHKTIPSASGALWITDREQLLSFGGLARFKHEVQAETKLATLFSSTYQCLVDAGLFGVSYEKKWSSQLETSRRLLYPTMRGWRAPLALATLLTLNIPTVVLLSAFMTGWTSLQYVFGLVLIAFMALYSMYTHIVWRQNWWLGGLLWPIIIAQELMLFVWSVEGYMRHSITWKGRPIAAPITQTERLEIER